MNAEILERYNALNKLSKKSLQSKFGGDPEMSKWMMVAFILQEEFGEDAVTEFFENFES